MSPIGLQLIICSWLFLLAFPLSGQTDVEELKRSYLQSDDSLKLELLRQITRAHIKQNDSVLKYAHIGVQESEQLNNNDYEGKFRFYLTIALQNDGDYIQAIDEGTQGLISFDLSDNALWAAGLARQISQVFIDMLMYDSAMVYCLRALDYHNRLEVNPGTVEALGTMARIHELNSNIDQAIHWNKRMLALAREHGFESYYSEAFFNLGNVYDLKEEYDSAIYYKKLALQEPSEVKIFEYVQLLGNIGNSYLLKGQFDSALHYTQKFYRLARDESEELYRRDKKKARSAINLGALFFKIEQLDKAKIYLTEGIRLAEEAEYPEKIIEAHRWLYEIYKAEERYAQALNHYEHYNEMYQAALNSETQTTIQQLTYQFDTRQKAQEISLLKLESDLKDSQLQQAELQKWVLALGLLIMPVVGYLFYNRLRLKQSAKLADQEHHNQKMRFKSIIEAEEKERKRIAMELHDGLGQLLSTARLNVSAAETNHQSSKHLNNSLKLIDEAVGEVRNISHNLMPNALISIGFLSALKEQIHLINDAGKFKVHLQSPDELPEIEESLSISLYRIVQEILNNAIKYSEANSIHVNIEVLDAALIISIQDDGKGFETSSISGVGIGWESIQSRVEVINGAIRVTSHPGEGTSVKLSIAV